MASKKNKVLCKLVSSAGTGYYYVRSKSAKVEKLTANKYDPVVRKHVPFKEQKLSS